MALGKKGNAYLQPFFRRLGSEFSDFVPRGTVLVHAPVDRLLGGLLLDPFAHGDKSERWLSYFVQPLAVPEDFLAIGFGQRIPRPKQRTAQTVHVRHEDDRVVMHTINVMSEVGLPALNSMLSLQGFYDYLNAWGDAAALMAASHWYEALVSTAMLLGRSDDALIHLQGGFDYYARYYGTSDSALEAMRPWEREQMQRFRVLRDHLGVGRLDAAKAQLETWRAFTVHALGIEDLMVPGELTAQN